jgi:hypothetical protein
VLKFGDAAGTLYKNANSILGDWKVRLTGMSPGALDAVV